MPKKPNNAENQLEKKGPTVTACDLFAGAGGLSLGAHQAGIEIAAAVEWDKHACETYRSNLILKQGYSTRLYQSDINDLDPQQLRDEAFHRSDGCDLLLGGPPCQGFSTHRIKDRGVDDPRNQLLLRYFEFVRVLRPKFFLVENVPGLLWDRHESYLTRFYQLGAKAGYGLMSPLLLNARDYGVPQNRKRVFILGYDLNVFTAAPAWPPTPTHGAPGSKSDLPEWRTAADAFKQTELKSDANNIHMNHGQELIEAFRRTPLNGGSRKDSGRVLPCHKNHDGHKDVYGRINPNQPGPTMTTACVNPSKGRFVHPTEHHGITVRQAARLQTFPDWFVFAGGLMAGGGQVGNAVPVRLAQKLLEPLRQIIANQKQSTLRDVA